MADTQEYCRFCKGPMEETATCTHCNGEIVIRHSEIDCWWEHLDPKRNEDCFYPETSDNEDRAQKWRDDAKAEQTGKIVRTGHIHKGRGEHDLTVSAFIVRNDGGILLHRHKKMTELFMQPGGHVELDEDPWAAVLREIVEETGYDPDQLQAFVPPWAVIHEAYNNPRAFHPYPMAINTHPIGVVDHWHTDLSYGFFVMPAEEEPMHEIAEGESDIFCWFDWRDWLDKGNPVTSEGISPSLRVPGNVQKIMKFFREGVIPNWRLIPVREINDGKGMPEDVEGWWND